MAMFFNDEYIQCPKCHNEFLYERVLNKYQDNPKDNKTLIQIPYSVELRCSECNTLVKKYIRDNSAPTLYAPVEANSIVK